VLNRLRWLGFDLDPEANEKGTGRVTTPTSRLAAFVIPTDEERVIARETIALIEHPG
jgi:acetate kinase